MYSTEMFLNLILALFIVLFTICVLRVGRKLGRQSIISEIQQARGYIVIEGERYLVSQRISAAKSNNR